MSNLKFKEMLLLLVVGTPLLILLLAIFTNMEAFHSVLGEIHTAIDTIALGLWDGIIILFFTGLALGVAYGVIRLRQMSRAQVVGPGRHGHAQQALIVNEGKGVQRIEHLQNSAMDPAAQIELLHQIMKVSAASAMSDQRLLALLAKQQQQTTVQQIEPPKEEPQDELPTNVRYEEVRGQVPRGHILVGIGRHGLETKEKAVGACVWIVGLSGTGKTSTTVLRVEERAADGHAFLGGDPHWFKDDSLFHAVYERLDGQPGPYQSRFLLPMAKDAKQFKAVLQAFVNEFNARKGGQRLKPWKPITLLIDEVGAWMDPTTEEEEEIKAMLPTIARICGQEARNFLMGGIFISQQATGLAWLRKMALMVLVHQLLMKSEKELACNGDMAVVESMKTWPIGRTYVYGVGFQEGPRTVQQPYFATPKSDSPATYPNGPYVEADATFSREQARNTGPLPTSPKIDVDADAETVPDVLMNGPDDGPMLGPNDLVFSAEQEAEFLRLHQKFPQAVKNTLRLMNNGRGLSNRYAKYAGWLLEREGLRG
jgi:hypothetical protein